MNSTRTILKTLLLLCNTLFVVAQQNISGSVTDAENQLPLPGVTILVEGKNLGTTTDFDGNFSLANINANDVLQFSYIGYQTQSITVGTTTTFNVQLQVATDELEEVVVVGYGTQKTRNVTGAVASVGKKALETLAPLRAEEALQGQATGVNVVASGSPGAKPLVLVRGIPSYSGTDPLVVIDGVPQTLDDLNALNPADIQKVDVLKDAATAAIYGVSGGNGVILVTTKTGYQNQKPVFNFNSSYAIQEVNRRVDVLNATEYAAILNEGSVASGGSLIYPDITALGEGTNWQDEIFVDAPVANHNLSVSGGTDKSTYFLSAGFFGQEGVVAGGSKSFFDRASLTANFSNQISERLKVILNTSYTNIKGSGVSENNIGSVLSNALNFDPTVKPYDASGNFGISSTITQEIINPLAQIDNTYNEGNTNKLFGKLELQYDVLKNLKLNSRFGYTFANVVGKTFQPLVFYGVGHNATNAHPDLSPIVTVGTDGTVNSTHSRVSESSVNYFSFTYEAFANYNFSLWEDHNFETVLGLSLQRQSGNGVYANAVDVPYNSWDYAAVSAATGDADSQTSSSMNYLKKNISSFARILYNYKEKYLASVVFRRDGSTVFGANNKFANFVSGSLGWIISDEDFFNSPFINFLKIRGSYGTIGNDNITPQLSLISTFPKYTYDGQIVAGSTLLTIPNNDVSWESQVQANIGFDARLFDNKFSITADYFEKNTTDLLFNPTLSLYLGIPVYPASNIGDTSTKGFDLSVGYKSDITENFNVDTTVNFTTAVNKVDAINNGDKFIWGSGYGIPYTNLTRFEEGYAPGYFFGYKTDGIFQNQAEVDAHATQPNAQPGDIRYVDVDGNGVINDKDRTEIGNPFPEFTLGWNMALKLYNFDLNVFTYASVGNDIYRAYDRNLNYTNKFASVLNRWRGAGTSNTEPRVSFVDGNNNRRASDRYVEDGSFVRIKNIQLGYNIPQNAIEGWGVEQLRLYAQVKNAFTFTNYSGIEPEISSGVLDTGIDRGAYPIPRIWTLGLNLTF